jgi:hypothetical protein
MLQLAGIEKPNAYQLHPRRVAFLAVCCIYHFCFPRCPALHGLQLRSHLPKHTKPRCNFTRSTSQF